MADLQTSSSATRSVGNFKLRVPLLCGLLAALGLAAPAQAGPIALGTWFEISVFGPPGTAHTGCQPNDPSGPICVASTGTPTVFADVPPYTFTAPAGGITLLVTDAFDYGDILEVFDFGGSIGTTSLVSGASGGCGNDPVPCLADPQSSSGSFNLAAGNHSVSFTLFDERFNITNGGAMYFQAVPEPSTALLVATGLAGLAVGSRRRA